MKNQGDPGTWGLHAGEQGELMIGNHGTIGLARQFGTPLHVVNARRLMKTGADFLQTVRGSYRGWTSVHYAMKCNSVPAVVEILLQAGMGLEVMTDYELTLALRLGCPAERIIVNGPCKTRFFLRACIDAGVRFLIADSLEELRDIAGIAGERDHYPRVLLRVNPDYTPRGMTRGTATGSRTGCAFGLDLRGGEVERAMRVLDELKRIRFMGFQMHIGTGIRHASDYAHALQRVTKLREIARTSGRSIRVLDVGGGFASPASREFGPLELLLYQAFGRLPGSGREAPSASLFARTISGAVEQLFGPDDLPELIFEPGRSIAGPNQFLLLTVQRVKERDGVGRWLIADGGLSTVTIPTYYEYHEVFLANDVRRPRGTPATITGPACFAGDVIYRNKRMPVVAPGEVIAIMDSGAYFTAMESSFGFPRPAIVAVDGASCRLVRTRETFEEMIGRDVVDEGFLLERSLP